MITNFNNSSPCKIFLLKESLGLPFFIYNFDYLKKCYECLLGLFSQYSFLIFLKTSENHFLVHEMLSFLMLMFPWESKENIELKRVKDVLKSSAENCGPTFFSLYWCW